MSTETANLGLTKPGIDENFKLDDWNGNSDIIDQFAGTVNAALAGKASAAALLDLTGQCKNRAKVNGFTSTLRETVPVSLPAGTYVISIGEITSTDTDASVCLLSLLDDSSSSIWSGGTTRGEGKTITVTIESDAASLMVYASDNYSHSSGDTVTVSNLMICAKADWDVSQAYVPYSPTFAEMYQMILALQQEVAQNA